MTSLLFFQFMVDLEHSGTWIPEAWSMILIFHSNRTIKFLTHKKGFKKMLFFGKNADVSKIKKALVLKGIISEIHICLY